MNLPTTPGPMGGYLSARVLDDGRLLCLAPLTFGRARLLLGPLDLTYYETGY
jgi:hypothetical protein